ncbi:MAG: hypothetical protein IKA48_05335, partial [Fibrobacter sp.]|nr:hypothetical protein [Fibrobacter sp.]
MQELDVDKCDSSNAGALFAVKNKNSAYYAANDSAYTDGDNSLVRLICAASGNSYAWHLATDIEKDTAALAKDLPADTAVAGKINTGLVYVKDSVWRRGTVLDTALRASCVAANRGTTDSLIVKHEPVWYICDVGDDASVPFAWREATTAEADTAGFGTPDRDTARVGNVNKSLVYVYEDADGDGNAKWRYGTELDALPGLGACTKNNQSAVKGATTTGGDTLWYTCASDKIVLVNGEQVPYVWREAQNIEVDTNGLGHSHAVGDIAWGNVNKNLLYVYENNNWVASYNKTMDVLVGKGCVDGLNGVVRRGSDGVNYTCYVRNEVDKNWVQPYGIMLDTVGWAQTAPAGGWKNGDVRNGRVNSEITYVYQDTCWRYGSALDSIFARHNASNGGRACIREGDTTTFKYGTTSLNRDSLYYVCTRQTVGDTIRKWVPAPDIYNDTKDFRDKCKQFDPDYGHGELLTGRVNTHKKYVCDNGSFREATYDEEVVGRGCVSFIHYHIYETKSGFKDCWPDGWYTTEDKETGILLDSDGNQYGTVRIGSQVWMRENLNRESELSILHDGVRYYRGSVAENSLCPAGWHLPDTTEWRTLLNYAGSDALKSKSGWYQDNNGTNEYRFTAYPDGYYYVSSGFQSQGYSAQFWTSSTGLGSGSGGTILHLRYSIRFNYNYPMFDSHDIYAESYSKMYLTVRCIQDKLD